MPSTEEVINQAIADFDNIEAAIKECGIDVPDGTDTSEYGNLIKKVSNADMSEYVKNTDYATADKGGVVKVENFIRGLQMVDGVLSVYGAEREQINSKVSVITPITPSHFDYALSKGTHQTMGDDYNVNALISGKFMDGAKGQLPVSYDAVKSYIENNCIKNDDSATLETAGVVKVAKSGNTYGIILNSNGVLQIAAATKNDITPKTNQNKPITPANLEYAVEVCTNQDSTATLTEAQLKLPPSTQYLKDVIGNIENALDELHAYAQALVNGGSTE